MKSTLTVAELEQFCKENKLQVKVYDYAEANGERATARKTDEHFVLGAEISNGRPSVYQLEHVTREWSLSCFEGLAYRETWRATDPMLLLRMTRAFFKEQKNETP